MTGGAAAIDVYSIAPASGGACGKRQGIGEERLDFQFRIDSLFPAGETLKRNCRRRKRCCCSGRPYDGDLQRVAVWLPHAAEGPRRPAGERALLPWKRRREAIMSSSIG